MGSDPQSYLQVMYEAEHRGCMSTQASLEKQLKDAKEEGQLMKDDLYLIAEALDIGARPYSGHVAVKRDFIPSIQALRKVIMQIAFCSCYVYPCSKTCPAHVGAEALGVAGPLHGCNCWDSDREAKWKREIQNAEDA